jgi:hypothetical protein
LFSEAYDNQVGPTSFGVSSSTTPASNQVTTQAELENQWGPQHVAGDERDFIGSYCKSLTSVRGSEAYDNHSPRFAFAAT